MRKRKQVTTLTIKRERLAKRQSLASTLVKRLRKRATPYEKTFYTRIRKIHPSVIFQKAFTRDGKLYIVDFYLPIKGIIIELDGSQHEEYEHKWKDQFRDETLESWGYKVIRLKNKEVDYIDIDLLLKQ